MPGITSHPLIKFVSLLTVVAGCSTQAAPTPNSSPTSAATAPAATPTIAASATAAGLPPMGDVPFYRVDLLGDLEEPGPAPASVPEQAWKVAIGPTATNPILTGGLLVVADNSTQSYVALDALTGTEKWRFATGATGVEFGSRVAAAADGLVFVSDVDAVYALDPATGAQKWKTPVANRGSRMYITDGVLYVGTVGGAVGLDTASGAERWRWNGPPDLQAQVGAIADNTIYINSGNGRLYAIDAHDATQRWAAQARGTILGSPVIAGSTIYTYTVGESAQTTGELYAIDRQTGTIRWRYSAPSGDQLTAGPVRDNVVYVSGHQDGIYALRDDGNVASIVWNTPAPEASFPMSIADNVLFEPRNDGSIGAYSVADGHLLWETPALGGNAGGPPLVSGGMVFEASESAGVIAYADPSLIALLPQANKTPSAATPTPSVPEAVDPFTFVKAFPWSTTKLAIPLGSAGGPDGLLYVIDTKPEVTVIDPADGHIVRTWGSAGAGPGEFDIHRDDDNPGNGDIAVDADGLVYVADGSNYRVQVFKSDGTFVRQFGSFGTGPGQLAVVNQIAVGPEGNVYVTTGDGLGMDAFTNDGKFLWHIGHTTDFPYAPSSVVVLSDGTVVTASEPCPCLLFVDPSDGHLIKRVDETNVPPAAECCFGLLSLDSDDHIYDDVYGSEAKVVFNADGTYVAAKLVQPGQKRYEVGRSVIWSSDLFYLPPAFLPDGRAFGFMAQGVAEFKVTLPGQ